MKCPLCKNENFSMYELRPEYDICNDCDTIVLRENERDNTAFNKEKYKILPSLYDAMIRVLHNDKGHYDRLFLSLKDKGVFDITNIEYNHIHSFGGGIPKLECHLKHNDITVYDLCPEEYSIFLEQFSNIYNYNKKVNYKEYAHDLDNDFYEVLKNVSGNDNKDIFTFVHFLEHLSPENFLRTFDDIIKFKSEFNNKRFLIYQPNFRKTIDFREWVHFLDQHVVMFPLKSFEKFLTSMGFTIIMSTEHSDDLMILFK